MATVLKRLPPEVRPGPGLKKDRKPWDTWLDGRVWKLTEKDLSGSIQGGRNSAFTQASRRGKKLVTRFLPPSDKSKEACLIIQAMTPSQHIKFMAAEKRAKAAKEKAAKAKTKTAKKKVGQKKTAKKKAPKKRVGKKK